MAESVIALVWQPFLYAALVAVGLAFYLVWALAKQQYLGIFQQFNLLAISLSAGVVAILVSQAFFPGYVVWPWVPQQLGLALRQPLTIYAITIGYLAAGLAGWKYITSIHYPYWRTTDSNSLGLSVVVLGCLVGILLQKPSIILAVASVAWSLVMAGLLIMYHKTERPGLTLTLFTIAVFGLAIGLRYAFVPWQGIGSIVEYAVGGVGIIVGILTMLARLRVSVPHTTLAQLPAGVSQKFRDTFTRSLIVKQPPKSGGSSHS